MQLPRRKLRILLTLGKYTIYRHATTGAGSGASVGTGRTVALQKMREWHRNAFSNKFLLFTNVGISLTLSSLGDVLEQQLELYNKEIEEYSSIRTRHMATSGVAVGIICHYWYQLLDKYLPGRTFFVTLGILEKKEAHEVWEEIKEKAWKLYAAEWTVWPVAQFVNFYWIPTHYRIFYDNVISLGYDVFTSKVKHSPSTHMPSPAAPSVKMLKTQQA
ncbi:uncharacterized protein Dmoj_GI15250 [Drosophila mojavensis]|uniref:Mpv17-like protein 2 n=1 Tax=Drosophila mojavensis TaxID=7230 RepID=B4L1S2_DROMO|nr:uncharacterized protein Dmoj_GI15250 [Drosophila mojavensis]